MGREVPITSIALLPLCYPSNTGPFLLRGRFVASVPPRFTNFLIGEIRATKTGELEVRHMAGLSFRADGFSKPMPAEVVMGSSNGGQSCTH